jgi:hypothetical protein
VRGAGRHRRPHRHVGHPPKNPGVIAPEYLALFAEIAHPRKRVYLAAYVQERGEQTRSRKTAGGGSSHSRWLREDPEYRAAFERARLAVADAVERDVWRAAGRSPNPGESLIAFLARLGRKGYGEGRKIGK